MDKTIVTESRNNFQCLAFLILARNEENVIGQTIRTTQNALSENDALFVVADNCTDQTAQIAQNTGARVFIRESESTHGKGESLSWFLTHFGVRLQGFSLLIILDADSQVKPDFAEKIKARTQAEDGMIYQCFVYPIYDKKSPVSKLAALSELFDQHISDRIRSFFRWPVRLRGTGMVFKPETLIAVADQLHSLDEDIDISILLAAQKLKVRRIDEAIVFDPKPATSRGAARQRARWFRGQWQAFWYFKRQIGLILLQGPAGWSLLSSLFLKPKWLVLSASFILAVLLHSSIWASLFFWIFLFLNLSFLFIGMTFIPERTLFFHVFLHIPSYVFMWMRSIILAILNSSWLSVKGSDEPHQ